MKQMMSCDIFKKISALACEKETDAFCLEKTIFG
jgi:hypothetical protein